MGIQLKEAPKIKITLRNGDLFSDVAPNYIFDSFRLTKKLLEPNCFYFEVWRDDLTLEDADFRFNLRDELLGAKVECSLVALRYDEEQGEDVDDVVENFFYGYIQNIKVLRRGVRTPVTFSCTAYSPDSRLKQFPTCSSRFGVPLAKYAADIIYGPAENTCKFDVQSGRYDGAEPMMAEINPRYNENMPYTVQYHESGYDFLIRLAKRYGEFFYYEDSCLHFGEMKEYDPIHLRTGIDVEKYYYDLNMNDHLGTILGEYDYENSGDVLTFHGMYKWREGGWKQAVESPNEMAQSAFDHSMEYFNDQYNTVIDFRSARLVDEKSSRTAEDVQDRYVFQQHDLLEKYVMADGLVCNGVALRAVLKLGSVIVIEDETHTGPGQNPDVVEHEPLKVIDVYYEWNSHKGVLNLVNRFKAIPQKMQVPPYLQRDEHGFLTYGDFDIFPRSGPQMGLVVANNDPLGMGRVQVVMLWQITQEYARVGTDSDVKFKDMEMRTPWIRVAHPYNGYKANGSYVVPELLNEVIVSFEHDNVERPYVSGVVHNGFYTPVDQVWSEEGSLEKNEYKAFRTRNGHTIEIRDKDENGYIKIYDNKTHNYVVTLDTDSKKITLESRGNIELSADNNIVLNAKKNVIVKAGEKVDITANQYNSTIEDHVWIYAGGFSLRAYEEGFSIRSAQKIEFNAYMSDLDNVKSCKTVLSLSDNVAGLAYYEGTEGQYSRLKLTKDSASLEGTMGDTGVVLYSKFNNVKIRSDNSNIDISSGDTIKISPLFDMILEGASLKAEGFTMASIESKLTQIKGTQLKLN